MRIEFYGWKIDYTVDSDGHLTLGLNHGDESKVIEVDEDLSTNNAEWVGRFTTEKVEKVHTGDLEFQGQRYIKK